MRQATKFLCIAASCAGLLANYAGGQSRPSAPSITVAPKAGATQPSSAPADSKEISASFKDMSVEKIGTFLSEKLKKPVLITDDIKAKKITIICKKKIPLAEAISLIRQALLAQEIMVEELPSLIRIRPVGEVMQAHLVRVPADRSVATIEDTIQIVAKEFFIRHYDVQKMVDVLKPMQPSFGHIMADPDTRKLVVTDTVANLIRIEQIIAGMDVPMAERTLTEIIKVEHGDASEIVAIVRWLIAGRMGIHVKGITTATGEPTKKTKTSSSSNRPGVSSQGPSRGRPSSIPPSRGKDSEGGKVEIGVTQIKPSEAIVTLVPHVSRNWIIAVAPAEIMVQIKIWVKQLDKPREVEKDYELYDVKYADINDVARQIEQAIQSLPSTELRDTTHVVPFGQSKKLIVFGSKTGRKMVRDLLSRLDVEDAEKRTRRTFILKHADAEEMAERIENLFSAMHVDYKYDYGGWYGGSSTRYRRDPNAPQVTIVPDKRRNAITVITDSETMLEIEELIRQEDTPVDPDEVKPKVYELKYIDAGEMRDLLSEMFSESESGRRSFWDYYFSPQRRESKPVGRLLGQFTFQVLPSSSKLIVNSKSIANYEVIDKLIEELDRPQRAGVPEFVELKFANAEDLCEQLNALLAEPGTLARIRRADRGLAERQKPDSEQSKSKSSGSSPDAGKPAEPGEMAFWWQGFRRPQGQVPTSNLIGKIRIVPVYRRNALMVLAPEGYKEPIRELIEELDQPGRQVMIKARIGEIQHQDQTTLGLRIASDPSILSPADTALGGSASATGTYTKTSDAFFSGTLVLGVNSSVSALLHLLIREFGMKILMEPAITTSDNEASEYFDGQDISVQTEVRTSAEGTSTITASEYREVGTRLRVRPHITKNGNVDLLINLEISRSVPGSTAQGNPTFDRREVTTHVIVKSGQTIMLSGIIRQEEFDDVRKVPLLGDIPLIGKLFRSIDKGMRNREMVIFITPQAMSTAEQVDAQMKKPRETLDRIEKSIFGDQDVHRTDEHREVAP